MMSVATFPVALMVKPVTVAEVPSTLKEEVVANPPRLAVMLPVLVVVTRVSPVAPVRLRVSRALPRFRLQRNW